MLNLARSLIAEVGRPAAIGVSFGGPVDAKRGQVHLSHHVANWENFPLQARLEAEFDLPTAIDNDANIGALGEWAFGAGQGCSSLLYVTVSTGIGGGWIIDGNPYQGFNGMAGEIGHIVVNPGGMPCVCGKKGCLEAEACGPAIALRARQTIEADPEAGAAMLQVMDCHPQAITAKEINRAAEAGQPLARAILTDSARFLGQGLGGAITLMNPQRVVLGGGVTKSGEGWWQTVRKAARYHTLPEIPVDIVPAGLGDDAPLWGAAALAQRLIG
jgi:glucokinase